MSRILLVLAASAVLAPASAPAWATSMSGSAAGAASATVVSPITVRQIADLDFGVIAANGNSARSVTILPGVAAARYGGSARLACGGPDGCPAPHFASFEVIGEANRSYTISAPASVAVSGEPVRSTAGMAQSSAPPVLRVEAIGMRSASRPDAGAAGRLDPAGRDRFDLGGTLRITGTMPPARYRVSIPVIVTYS